MIGDILTCIEAKKNEFTKAEKKIADFVKDHAKEVMYMSITELAEACEVGDSSVFRFCKTLGLKGYQEFKLSLAQSDNHEEDSVPELVGEVRIQDSLEDVAKKVLVTNMNALNETYALLNIESLSSAIEYMIQANKILFVGVGSSSVTAMEAKSKFMRIIPNTDYVSDSHLQAVAARLLTEKDLVIIISYSGATKEIIEVARLAKEAQAKVIGMTRFNKSPLASYADILLLCGGNEGPLQGGALTTKLSQLYLLDILYMEFFKRTFESSKRNRDITAEAVIDKRY